ncbi:hypothetical protein [Burkholderia sp. 3C]
MSLFARWVGALRATLSGAPSVTAGRSIDHDDAPEDWRAYAEHVSRCMCEALDAPGVTPASLAVLDGYASACVAAGEPSPALRLRAWLDVHGRIARVEASPGAVPAVSPDSLGAALTAVLVGRPVGETPPRGMPQPVLVRLGFAGTAQ